MPAGQPTKYDPIFIDKVDEYLELCKDEYYDYLKGDGPKGNSYERRVKVKLPTRKSFARFINVPLRTMEGWYHIDEFSRALEKIDLLQHERLIDGSLSSDYNPTIAKLLLSSNHGYKETKNMQNDGGKFDSNIKLTIVDGSSDSETI